jgi:E3 ubiquitin-protein ligase RNF14
MITVEVPVLLPKSHTLVIYKEDSTAAPVVDGQPPLCLDVTALPPILINIALPDTYPTHAPPQILSLHSTHSWLPPMAALEDRLLALWTSQDGVLYSWIEYLESARFLDDLGMLNSTSDTMRCVSAALS